MMMMIIGRYNPLLFMSSLRPFRRVSSMLQFKIISIEEKLDSDFSIISSFSQFLEKIVILKKNPNFPKKSFNHFKLKFTVQMKGQKYEKLNYTAPVNTQSQTDTKIFSI